MIEEKIQSILRANGTMTTGMIKNRLQHDHNLNKPTYHVRAILNVMLRHGMVSSRTNEYKTQLSWGMPYAIRK